MTRSIDSRNPLPIERFPILDVKPIVEAGRWPAKAFAGELIPFSAVVFREGHDALGVELLLTSPSGKTTTLRMRPGAAGSDRWHTESVLNELGRWNFKIRAFADDFETWHHNTEVKLTAGVDEDLMMLEGIALLTRAASEPDRAKTNAKTLVQAAEVLGDAKLTPVERFRKANSSALEKAIATSPIRSHACASEVFTINCERTRAGVGAWYEFFPRSEGAKFDAKSKTWTSGTFKTAGKRLSAVAAMGFDVLYLPPIHPIGRSFRKGPNNTLTAGEQDPGSPWAIGSDAGGHDTIHPDLGTEKDFKDFIKTADSLGIEIAMDLAVQASPDHPWVSAHPEWFTTRADGTIAYAENPPKKYQDIYPINFDNDRTGIYLEILNVVKKWVSFGVKIFRVDNPHTKPVHFWEWLIAEVNDEFPDVVFLAEAFTKPAMMQTLGKVGFQQSYTYFTWRNTPHELKEYLGELAYFTADHFRPNFWVSTPDILTQYLQFGGRPAHKIRAAIAATAVPSWGMYAGYELIESVARPGAEEHIDSEKFQYKPRDWAAAAKTERNISSYITKLNELRRDNPALRQLRNIEFHASDDGAFLVFSKHIAAEHSETGKANTVIVVVNTDPHAIRETTVRLDMAKLHMAESDRFEVTDLITGEKFTWSANNFVRLDAFVEPAHILLVTKKL